MKHKLAYSTDKLMANDPEKSSSDKQLISDGPARVLRQTKRRGGKVVTVIQNIPLEKSAIKVLATEIRKRFACGATFKNDQLEVQGDVINEIEEFLKEKKVSVAGR